MSLSLYLTYSITHTSVYKHIPTGSSWCVHFQRAVIELTFGRGDASSH